MNSWDHNVLFYWHQLIKENILEIIHTRRNYTEILSYVEVSTVPVDGLAPD